VTTATTPKSWQQYIWEELPTEAIARGRDDSRDFRTASSVCADWCVHAPSGVEEIPGKDTHEQIGYQFALLYSWERKRLFFAEGDSLLVGWRVDKEWPGEIPLHRLTEIVLNDEWRKFNADTKNTPELLENATWIPVDLSAYGLTVTPRWEYVLAEMSRDADDGTIRWRAEYLPGHWVKAEHEKFRNKNRNHVEAFCDMMNGGKR
jgi:hypothetical protein